VTSKGVRGSCVCRQASPSKALAHFAAYFPSDPHTPFAAQLALTPCTKLDTHQLSQHPRRNTRHQHSPPPTPPSLFRGACNHEGVISECSPTHPPTHAHNTTHRRHLPPSPFKPLNMDAYGPYAAAYAPDASGPSYPSSPSRASSSSPLSESGVYASSVVSPAQRPWWGWRACDCPPVVPSDGRPGFFSEPAPASSDTDACSSAPSTARPCVNWVRAGPSSDNLSCLLLSSRQL
jgi:hypothetical protein